MHKHKPSMYGMQLMHTVVHEHSTQSNQTELTQKYETDWLYIEKGGATSKSKSVVNVTIFLFML